MKLQCRRHVPSECLKENRIPIFHFSELLSLALEGKFSRSWLKRHLINPALVEEKQLINGH